MYIKSANHSICFLLYLYSISFLVSLFVFILKHEIAVTMDMMDAHWQLSVVSVEFPLAISAEWDVRTTIMLHYGSSTLAYPILSFIVKMATQIGGYRSDTNCHFPFTKMAATLTYWLLPFIVILYNNVLMVPLSWLRYFYLALLSCLSCLLWLLSLYILVPFL